LDKVEEEHFPFEKLSDEMEEKEDLLEFNLHKTIRDEHMRKSEARLFRQNSTNGFHDRVFGSTSGILLAHNEPMNMTSSSLGSSTALFGALANDLRASEKTVE
jgi:hypothetical protein